MEHINMTSEKREDVRSYLVVKRVNTPYTWNEVVLEIKKEILVPILKKVEDKWSEKYSESEEIINTIKWNIVNILALSAFRKYKSDPFHEELLKIYEQGYFPCGWKGTYPEGKIVQENSISEELKNTGIKKMLIEVLEYTNKEADKILKKFFNSIQKRGNEGFYIMIY